MIFRTVTAVGVLPVHLPVVRFVCVVDTTANDKCARTLLFDPPDSSAPCMHGKGVDLRVY